MPLKAYLTIDDSPSSQTDALTDFLADRNIPALLFCRGDRLSQNPAPIVRAIEKGFVIGNHAWSHRRFSTLGLDDCITEIDRTDELIDDAYDRAGIKRPGKYFRFPHMDRGAGGWIVDFDAAGEHRAVLEKLFADGLNIDLTPPSPAQVEKKQALQDYLQSQGFTPPPFAGVSHPWYAETELDAAIDAMFTFSTADWMITPRHKGKWPYKTLEDLKAKIDNDPWLKKEDSAHIVLVHDQDDLFATVSALVEHFLSRAFVFA